MQPEPADTERRYSQTEKEALAIVWACERLHAYLYGAECELMTDHKPVECILSPKSPHLSPRPVLGSEDGFSECNLQIYSEIYSRS